MDNEQLQSHRLRLFGGIAIISILFGLALALIWAPAFHPDSAAAKANAAYDEVASTCDEMSGSARDACLIGAQVGYDALDVPWYQENAWLAGLAGGLLFFVAASAAALVLRI